MKSFALALLATSACVTAADADWVGFGDKVTAGDVRFTPKLQVAWSMAADSLKMSAQWSTETILEQSLDFDDIAQVWWCVNFSPEVNTCTVFDFMLADATNALVKARIYEKESAAQPEVDATNAMEWFNKSANGYNLISADNFSGSAAAQRESLVADYKWGSPSVALDYLGTELFGSFSNREGIVSTRAIRQEGKTYSAAIGAYARDASLGAESGASKQVEIFIEPEFETSEDDPELPLEKRVTGKQKYWTGPSVSVDTQTIVAGGSTQWKYTVSPDKKTTTVMSWLCQSATATKALSEDNVVQVFL